jgi:CRP/FNR family cyclic AMP-dependent transcriptional regulator
MAVSLTALRPAAEPVVDGDRSAAAEESVPGHQVRTYGALMESGLLGGLTADEQRAVVASMVRRSFRKDDTLFHEGDPGDSLLIVERGRVAIRVSTPMGDVATLAILGRGDSFGEQALLDASAVRTASAIALEPVEVRMLHRRQFDELREAHPSINQLLVDLLAAQVRRLSAHLLDALYLPVEQRVLRRLNDLSTLYDSGTQPIVIPLRQDDLASLAGTTRPTANRVLRHLERDEIIALHRGQVHVLDRVGLTTRAR